MLMENVQSFINAAKSYGVPDAEMFLTPDLFEARNLSQVLEVLNPPGDSCRFLHHQVALCIYSLARATQKHPEFSGPSLGPKFATKNERNFSEEQIRKGRDGVLGLQSGSNKGASQVYMMIIIHTYMSISIFYKRPDTVAWEIPGTCKITVWCKH